MINQNSRSGFCQGLAPLLNLGREYFYYRASMKGKIKRGLGDVFPKRGPEIFGPFRMCVATHAMLAKAKQRRNLQLKTADKHPIKNSHGKQLST